MIQRIQTLYFFIALLLVSSTFFGFEIFSVKLDELGTRTFDVTAFHILDSGNVFQKSTLWIYSAVAALTLIITIMTFKNREKQITLAKMAILIVLLVGGWFVVMGNQFLSKSEYPKNHGVILGLGFYLFASSIIFIVLGLMGVRKDKKLIDSADRIR